MQGSEGELSVSQRRPDLAAEPAVPPHCRGFVTLRLTIEKQQAEGERVLKRHLRHLRGGCQSDCRVPLRDRSPESRVGRALRRHEQMFAQVRRPLAYLQSMSERSESPRVRKWIGVTVATAAIGAAVTWGVLLGLNAIRNALKDEVPVAISMETNPARVYPVGSPNWQTYGFVSRTGAADLATPPSILCRNWPRWARREGYVDADQTRLFIYLQGKANTAVAINGLEVRVVRRGRPVAGTYGWCPGGGAAASPRLIDVDLDAEPPRVRYGQPGDDFPFRRRLLFTLTGPETEVLQLVAHTRRCDCEWRAVIHMRVNGKRIEGVVEDQGKPFRTAASARSTHLQWDGKRWRPMSRREWKQALPVRWDEIHRQ